MPIGRIGSKILKRVEALENDFASGYVKELVTGSSIGFGGTEPPLFVPTDFKVKAAVGNLAKEYDLRDAAQIYNFGDDIFCGEMRISLPEDPEQKGFYVEFQQLDPNEQWELAFNWYARG